MKTIVVAFVRISSRFSYLFPLIVMLNSEGNVGIRVMEIVGGSIVDNSVMEIVGGSIVDNSVMEIDLPHWELQGK